MLIKLLGGTARGQEIEVESLANEVSFGGERYVLTNEVDNGVAVYLYDNGRPASITMAHVTGHNASQGKRFKNVRFRE